MIVGSQGRPAIEEDDADRDQELKDQRHPDQHEHTATSSDTAEPSLKAA